MILKMTLGGLERIIIMVKIYRSHRKSKYHMRSYNSSIAIMEKNMKYFQF